MRLLACFLILPFFSDAQDIPGLGDFKVGKTSITIIDSIKNANGFQIKQCLLPELGQMQVGYDQRTKTIFEILPNYVDPEQFTDKDALFLDNSKTYFFRSLQIAGIEVLDVKLIFYRDTLIKIRTFGGYQLTGALTAKYKLYKHAKWEKHILCEYKLTGRPIPKLEKFESWIWDGKQTYSKVEDGFYFDKKCEEQSSTEFILFDKKKFSSALTLSEKAKSALIKEKNKLRADLNKL